MHCKSLGIDKLLLGSTLYTLIHFVLGGSVEENLKVIWDDIEATYDELDSQDRYGAMRQTMFLFFLGSFFFNVFKYFSLLCFLMSLSSYSVVCVLFFIFHVFRDFMFTTKSQPKLKGKAAEVKCLGPVLARVWEKHLNPGCAIHQKILIVLKGSKSLMSLTL